MAADFRQIEWDDQLDDDCRQIVRLAVREDLADQQDWTTVALTPEARTGSARIVAREGGVAAGMRAVQTAAEEMQLDVDVTNSVRDGDAFESGAPLTTLTGSVRDMLTSERILLNLLGRLVGVATLTRSFVEQVAGTNAQIYDTRKTTPGWRRLEKHAVRCGGGRNHRTGLYDAVLIKDNHLAQMPATTDDQEPVVEALRVVRTFLSEFDVAPSISDHLIEIEVDSLSQLRAVLPHKPDIVLLDNMSPAQLRQAVAARNELAPKAQLEASGGVSLATAAEIAASGVDRISVGSLTHAATSVDVGLDWGD